MRKATWLAVLLVALFAAIAVFSANSGNVTFTVSGNTKLLMGTKGEVFVIAQFDDPRVRKEEPIGPLAYDWRITKTNPKKSLENCTLIAANQIADLVFDGKMLGKHVITLQFTATDTWTGKYVACGEVDVEFTVYAEIKLTIYVDQPESGTRATHTIKPFSVGHAWWRFVVSPREAVEQLVPDPGLRKYVNIPLGFYPDGTAGLPPWGAPILPGTLKKNDRKHQTSVDVTRSFSITPERLILGLEFCRVVDLDLTRSLQYNLYDYNCVDMTIDVARLCGIDLPDNHGWIIRGYASNCGDFGEDLRIWKP